MNILKFARIGMAIATAFSASAALAQEQVVNIYTYREPGLITPLLDKFQAETGIKPVILFANNGLIERLAAEGENSPADIVLTTDIGNLAAAKALGVTQTITLPDVAARVPEAYRDVDGQWTALSLRARVFYASRDRVDADSLSYQDLTNPEWKGRLCTRSGQHVYSIGLIASYIAHNGADAAHDWLSAVRDNLTGRPTGNDRAQVKAVYSGACDLAIGNTYYMGLMQNNVENPEQQEWAKSVKIIFPTGDGFGTHVNVSGAMIAKYAPHKDNAEKLLSFLLSDESQSLYAEANYEYPVVAGVAPSATVSAWGELTPDDLPLTAISDQREAASALADELQFDNGPQN